MANAWTDELKNEAIEAYTKKNPTAETSMEIVAEIADNMGFTANSVRMILSKAEVYVAKGAGKTASGAKKETATGAGRVSKEASHAALAKAIEAAGKSADMEIIGKLTGKAAVYFTDLFK